METAITVLIWMGVVVGGLYVLTNVLIIGFVLYLYWKDI